MVKNPAKESAKRKRLKVVEELMLNGYRTGEIYDLIGEQYNVSYKTIRMDIVEINKAHNSEITKLNELEGRSKYLASLKQVRRKAMSGWNEEDSSGVSRVRGRDYKLAHQIDQEIARLSGVALKQDEKTINLNITAARNEMEKIMGAVFSVVTDKEIQDLIIKEIEALATDSKLISGHD
jgi:hypothetical protein